MACSNRYIVSVLAHLTILLLASLAHVDVQPNVWMMGVRDVPWFEHRHIAPSTAFRNSVKPLDQGLQPHNDSAPAIALFPDHHSWRSRFLSSSSSSGRENTVYPFSPGDSVQRGQSLLQKFMPQQQPPLPHAIRPIPQHVPPAVPFTIERLVPYRETEPPNPPPNQNGRRQTSLRMGPRPLPSTGSLASSAILGPSSRNFVTSSADDTQTNPTTNNYRLQQSTSSQPQSHQQTSYPTIPPPPPPPPQRSYSRPMPHSLQPPSPEEVHDANEFYSAHVQSALRPLPIPRNRERDRD